MKTQFDLLASPRPLHRAMKHNLCDNIVIGKCSTKLAFYDHDLVYKAASWLTDTSRSIKWYVFHGVWSPPFSIVFLFRVHPCGNPVIRTIKSVRVTSCYDPYAGLTFAEVDITPRENMPRPQYLCYWNSTITRFVSLEYSGPQMSPITGTSWLLRSVRWS